ncbi:DUF4339 domain-containing protein [Mesoterricola silvestris]|uniref:GYF domain-containing protein n=1 Tax=Mesoterricola silvestris TaxID=2927979 RepID=A0AA48GS87_9BACT|nr:DUF4339 domain-containing protein [Mesoterricola silvestris]BDU74725.1 hypothetical protein METEAL_38990 [Mesoterricola silvestris]
MDVAWYYSAGGQDRTGPVSWAEIEAAYRSGVIGPQSLLWASHLAGWVPAGTLLDAPTPPPPPASGPAEAPGSRAAFHCGLWALLSMCLCFPVALALAIAAIVQNQKASRMARENPGTYRKPGNGGLVMAIIALCVLPLLALLGIVSAIAIPAFLGQRERARDKAAIANLDSGLYALAGDFDRLKDRAPQEIKAGLEAGLRAQPGRNPWNEAAPAFSYEVEVVTGTDGQGFRDATRAAGGALGQCAYVVQFPGEHQPGMVGGVVRTKNPVGGSPWFVKVRSLD